MAAPPFWIRMLGAGRATPAQMVLGENHFTAQKRRRPCGAVLVYSSLFSLHLSLFSKPLSFVLRPARRRKEAAPAGRLGWALLFSNPRPSSFVSRPRPQRTRPPCAKGAVSQTGTQTQPNEMVVFGRGGARSRGSNPAIRCGIADDTQSVTTRGIVTCMGCPA